MMKRFLPILAVMIGLAGATVAADKPNVVLIVCDDLNDYITGIPGQTGHPQSLTPNVEKLAKSGVAFRRAYSNNPVCAPSRSSFLTGIYCHTSGNLFWAKWFENPVLKNSKTIMQHFRDNGYYAAGSGKLMHHGLKSEWDEFPYEADYGPSAFDGKERVAHPSVPMPFAGIGSTDGSYGSLESSAFVSDGNPKSGWDNGSWNEPELMKFNSADDRDPTPDERNAQWAADRIAQFAEQKSDQPFFLGVGFVRPHTPCIAPKKYFDMFPLDEIELPVIKPGDADDTHYHKLFDAKAKGLRYYRMLMESYADDELALKTFAQAYLACVKAVDDCIGQVIDAVDNSPFRDNTIIVLTSDHGWQMGQKDFLFKNSPWEESTRIPFVVRAPGVAKPGGVAEHPISLIDLYPTLVDLCGLEGDTRKNAQGAKLDGHSVRPFLEDPKGGTWDGPDGALSMIFAYNLKKKFSEEEIWQLKTQLWTLRTERWRYIRYNDGSEELYDHEKDPREWTNLADSPEHAAIKAELKGQMLEMIGPMDRKNPAVDVKAETSKKKWDWFGALDKDKDGFVTEEEWLKWEQKKKDYNEAAQKEYFAGHDANGDGLISRAELEKR